MGRPWMRPVEPVGEEPGCATDGSRWVCALAVRGAMVAQTISAVTRGFGIIPIKCGQELLNREPLSLAW